MAKVTRPEPTVSWRSTVNRTLPTAEATRATATAVRVERTAAGRRPGLDRKTFTLLTVTVRRADGEPDALSLPWELHHAPGTGGTMAGLDGSRTQWRELFHEVVATNLCTGCAACVMACPRDVLDYDHAETYHPFNVELSTAADDCVHGQRGCDICTRA